jgi:hypothetical protein
MGAGSLWLWCKVRNALRFNALRVTPFSTVPVEREVWSLPIEIDGFHSPTPSAVISAVLPCRGDHRVQWDRAANGRIATQVSTVGGPRVYLLLSL